LGLALTDIITNQVINYKGINLIHILRVK
jgi:hypothetical protein